MTRCAHGLPADACRECAGGPPPYRPRPPLARAAFVLVTHPHTLRVLAVRHAASGGLWSLPGGKVEAGESAAHAALRECREEAGLAVVLARRIAAGFGRPLRPWPGIEPRALIVYEVEPAGPLPSDGERGPEGDALGWVGLEDLAPFFGARFVEGIARRVRARGD